MRVIAKYDRSIDAWVISNTDVVLRATSDITEWRRQLFGELEKLEGSKAYLLVDMDGIEVDIAMKDAWGETEKLVHEVYALDVLRFGEAAGFTNTVVMLESEKRGFAANLFPTRSAAEVALRRMRAAFLRQSEKMLA